MTTRLKADLAITACCLLWGATFVVVKDALDHSSVFMFMALRFTLAAMVMAAIYHSTLRKMSRATFWAGAQIGFFMFTGYAFQTFGLLYTTPSKAAFITGAGVVLVPLLLALFWGRRLNRWIWVGAVAAFVGLYLLTVPLGGISALNTGDPLVLVCAVMFALHIIYIGRHSPHHSVAALSFLQIAVTAVLTAIAIPCAAFSGLEPQRLVLTGGLLSAILITGIGATALAFSLQVWAQRHTSPSHTAILLSLEPVFAAITSYLLMDERLGPRALAGAALILAGILIAELKGPAPTAIESPASLT